MTFFLQNHLNIKIIFRLKFNFSMKFKIILSIPAQLGGLKSKVPQTSNVPYSVKINKKDKNMAFA